MSSLFRSPHSLTASISRSLLPATVFLLGCGSDPESGAPVKMDPSSAHVPTARDAGVADAGHARADSGTRPPTVDPASQGRDAGPSDQDQTGADGGSCGDGTKDDIDGDGFTLAQGDCDDCMNTINPGAYDVPDNDVDEDCSGGPAAGAGCDSKLSIASQDAQDGARAIGLCSSADASSRSWGVTAARYANASGTGKLSDPLAVGLLPALGAAVPHEGKALLALSSGVARAPDQAGYTRGCDSFNDGPLCGLGAPNCNDTSSTPPAGYPKKSTICPDVGGGKELVFNQSALELSIRVPTNALAFSFDSIFYTYEYPDFICSSFNDFFAVFMEPKPSSVSDGNIVFDSEHDPIGVNNGLLAVCDPTLEQTQMYKTFKCEQGTALLKGTGYGPKEATCGAPGGGAATGWLKTTVAVDPGSTLKLRFAIWDSNDTLQDSTALIDNFSWTTFEGPREKVPPPEVPVETVPLL